MLKKLSAAILLLALPSLSIAAGCTGTGTCYRVGCDGNANQTTKWATTSGGATTGGAPSSTDDCIWDSASCAIGYTITMNANIVCKSMTIGAPASGAVVFSSTGNLSVIGGDINFTGGSSGVTVSSTGSITIGIGTSNLTVNGVDLTALTKISITSGSAGTAKLILLDDSALLPAIELTTSTATMQLEAIGRNFTTPSIKVTGSPAVGSSITLTNSVISYSSSATAWDPRATGVTTSLVGSSMKCTNASGCTFEGGGSASGSGRTYGTFWCGAGTCVVRGTSTYSELKAEPATILTLSASATNTVTTATLSGTAGNLVTIQSSSAGTKTNLSKSSGTVNLDYISLQDNRATGGAFWNAGCHSVSVSGNSGWSFCDPNPSAISNTFFGENP